MINNGRNINMSNEQRLMLLDIQKLEFAIYDLSLYLDTHPNDPVALHRHKAVTEQLMQILPVYESKFGIMSIMSQETGNTWSYMNSPWPWEM
ncbi:MULTISPECIES: spore coat protein CotJB [unclassified Sedimentibacter]|uniref:spore coat protein CotJB n=1 Tax=unclassified Sedimentibacter TaxID=2649220 RepID=UPI0027DFC224|nr:spore coat protein CotJB [Sedimentibacter sp. MB35-C1]WMJ77830.1 spore coat protein CotJB [Sedimentibacter sp. MB35-C1]